MADAAVEHALRGEMALLEPEVRASRPRLEALLDEDFVEIGASGRRWEREALIVGLLASHGHNSVISDMTARMVCDHIALVTYVTTADDRRVTRSSWWRASEGTWKCFFHQGTGSPVEQ